MIRNSAVLNPTVQRMIQKQHEDASFLLSYDRRKGQRNVWSNSGKDGQTMAKRQLSQSMTLLLTQWRRTWRQQWPRTHNPFCSHMGFARSLLPSFPHPRKAASAGNKATWATIGFYGFVWPAEKNRSRGFQRWTGSPEVPLATADLKRLKDLDKRDVKSGCYIGLCVVFKY